MKTDTKAMGALFDKFAETLTEALKAEGGVNAPTLAVIRQFLKDNGITATAAKGSPLGDLVSSLPKFDDGDEAGDEFH